jgi:hypothetical protein
MIPPLAIDWLHLVFMLVLLNIHKICLKLKSGFRIIHKSPKVASQSKREADDGGL